YPRGTLTAARTSRHVAPPLAEVAMSVPVPDSDTRLFGRLLVMRIMVGAMALGVVTFLVIALVLRAREPGLHATQTGELTYVVLGLAAVLILLQAVVPGLVANSLRRRIAAGTWPPPGAPSTPLDDFGKLCALYQTRLLIGAALVEGGAFASLVAYLLEGNI